MPIAKAEMPIARAEMPIAKAEMPAPSQSDRRNGYGPAVIDSPAKGSHPQIVVLPFPAKGHVTDSSGRPPMSVQFWVDSATKEAPDEGPSQTVNTFSYVFHLTAARVGSGIDHTLNMSAIDDQGRATTDSVPFQVHGANLIFGF
jgi:hypothetical protein